jgi:hypothetical protein
MKPRLLNRFVNLLFCFTRTDPSELREAGRSQTGVRNSDSERSMYPGILRLTRLRSQ